jgi:hypothetical protein
MNPLNRLIGEHVKINERRYEIAGYNIADREVRVRAVPLDVRRERVVEVSLPLALKGLFRDRDPEAPPEVRSETRTKG